MKACAWCGVTKNADCFGKNAARPDGRHSACKECVNAKSLLRSKTFPERTKEILRKHVAKKRATDPRLYLWKKARDRVRYDTVNREFTITREDIIIPELCPYLGIPLNSGDPDAWASLDRIDSNKGYVPGNIQVISFLANQMKNRATKEQLIAFAKGVLAVHSKEVCCANSTM